MEAAVARGPHGLALLPEAREQHLKEVEEKVAKGQAKIFSWEHLKEHLPPNLKISPIAMIPHKSRLWRAILDLSFALKFNMGKVQSVNATSKELAPPESLEQRWPEAPTNQHWYPRQGNNT